MPAVATMSGVIHLSEKGQRKRHRFTVRCPFFVHDRTDGLVFMELVGVPTETRAVWAHLLQGRSERSLVDTNAVFQIAGVRTTVRINPTTKYFSYQTRSRLLLMHEEMTKQNMRYMLGGTETEPSPWFQTVLSHHLPYPFLLGWLPQLWLYGVSDNLIQPADSWGPQRVWKFWPNDYEWRRLIVAKVRSGNLKGADYE